MTEAPFQELSKLECADRQLCVAIRLFFERRDMIAVHTLATAAQEVLTDLADHTGVKGGIFRQANEVILPEFRDEFFRRARAPQNFFKHADRDPKERLKFYYQSTQYHIFDAAILSQLLRAESSPPPEIAAFFAWFIGTHPNTLLDDGHGLVSRIKQLAVGLDFRDYELVLQAIDFLALKKQ